MIYLRYYIHNMRRGRRLYEGPIWEFYVLGVIVFMLTPLFIIIPSYREQVREWNEQDSTHLPGSSG